MIKQLNNERNRKQRKRKRKRKRKVFYTACRRQAFAGYRCRIIYYLESVLIRFSGLIEGKRMRVFYAACRRQTFASYQCHIIYYLQGVRSDTVFRVNNRREKRRLEWMLYISTKNLIRYGLSDFIVRLGCCSRLFGSWGLCGQWQSYRRWGRWGRW